LARRSVVICAELALVLMMLLAVFPNAVVASGAPSEPTALSLSGGASAGSPMQYPWYYNYPWNYGYPWNYSYGYPYYWDYYWWSYPYYYYPTTTYQQTKTFQLDVATNPAGIVAVNGKGTYNDGTAVSFSVTSLVASVNANQRYVFSYWSGDFSGTSPSGTVTMTSAKSVVANYQLQNFLKVSVDPVGIASVTGDGWYLPTDSVTVGPVLLSISGGDGIRYVFQQWTVDSAPATGNSVEITMDSPHTLVAHYGTQYLLTASSDYGVVEGGGWYDVGSTATVSVTTEVDTSFGVKQVFQKWTGDMESSSATTAITMDSPHTLRAVWGTDSTILYATIALAILAAFAVGIGLTMFAIVKLREPRTPAPVPAPKPVAAVEPVPEKLEQAPTPTKKKTKPPPKTNQSETSSEE
jgi:hypothetical protein